MKNELKDSSEAGFPWMVGEQLQHFVETPGLPDEADGSMQREIKSLLAVYRLAETPQWAAATALLAQSRKVQIAGFQTERGIAMMLANHLQFMRDGVQRSEEHTSELPS